MALSADRKMCGVLYRILAREPAARSRCIPLAMHLPGYRTHSRASRPYRRSITRGKLRSPCTHRLGSILHPQDPRPFHGDQPCAVWMRVWVVEETRKYRWHIVYPAATLIR